MPHKYNFQLRLIGYRIEFNFYGFIFLDLLKHIYFINPLKLFMKLTDKISIDHNYNMCLFKFNKNLSFVEWFFSISFRWKGYILI